MIAIHNHRAPKGKKPFDISSLEKDTPSLNKTNESPHTKKTSGLQQVTLPSRTIIHNPRAGLNLVVDAASHLLTIVGKLKYAKSYHPLSKLQNLLVKEIHLFQDRIKRHGYNMEYTIVCRYILCATIDDVISNTVWGNLGQWNDYSLLSVFNQDRLHQEKFFGVLEHVVKEPKIYIDLMELIYICLSLGYKGQYRFTEQSQYQLEQIINNLYKHIQAYRGRLSKTLSSNAIKKTKSTLKTSTERKSSVLLVFFVTACMIMTTFVSLGYLMDIISNEPYKNITQIESRISNQSFN